MNDKSGMMNEKNNDGFLKWLFMIRIYKSSIIARNLDPPRRTTVTHKRAERRLQKRHLFYLN